MHAFVLGSAGSHAIIGTRHTVPTRAFLTSNGCHGSLAKRLCLSEVSGGRGCVTSLLLGGALHLRKAALREVLLWLNAIKELALAETRICVEVHSADDRDQKRITCVNAALDEESLQIAGVDEAEIAVVEVLVAGVQVVVIAGCQVLLEHLGLTAELQLLLEELGEAALNIIRQELVRRHCVCGPL